MMQSANWGASKASSAYRHTVMWLQVVATQPVLSMGYTTRDLGRALFGNTVSIVSLLYAHSADIPQRHRWGKYHEACVCARVCIGLRSRSLYKTSMHHRKIRFRWHFRASVVLLFIRQLTNRLTPVGNTVHCAIIIFTMIDHSKLQSICYRTEWCFDDGGVCTHAGPSGLCSWILKLHSNSGNRLWPCRV